ncbi:MAG: hypothetical protein GYA36_16185 [Veillonellaceae bacterium]|nr:hypothetical protein [Veillonellaceae bacterium]
MRTKKTPKEKKFSKYIHKWCRKTWAGWWRIDVIYFTAHEFLKLNPDCTTDTLAVCHTKWQYMTATMEVNLDKLEEQKDSTIEFCAVHELMHVFLNEMREEGIEHEERVATFLARSFMLAGGNND